MSLALGISALQIAKVSAVLPLTGAWDTPRELFCSGAGYALLAFTYTRGDAAGAFDFQVELSPYSTSANVPTGAEEWVSMAMYEPDTLAAGTDAGGATQREYIAYTAAGVGAEGFAYGPMRLGGTVERIRVRARESGNKPKPGTLAATLTLNAGG